VDGGVRVEIMDGERVIVVGPLTEDPGS